MSSGEQLRNDIINAALNLFLNKGFHPTTVTDIVTAAGCSKGGFYHHFSSKDELLLHIHNTFITYELNMGMAAMQRPVSATERLKQIIIDLVESIEIFRPHVTVFFEERRVLSSDKFSLVTEKRDQYENLVHELIKEGVRKGEFHSDLNTKIATLALFGMCNWTYQWLRPNGSLTAREIAEIFFDIFFNGIRNRTTNEDISPATDKSINKEQQHQVNAQPT